MSSERQLDNTNNPWWGEHMHRYEEVVKLIPNLNARILDIACGSGFGSFFLSRVGYDVVGGDLSESTVMECKQKYQSPNLEFKVINGIQIPYPDDTFDALISFETIEHTTQFNEMLLEFKRVCKKQAVIIISTPNFLVNSPNGIIINKYHTQEWKYEEFYELLQKHFYSFEILGQQYSRYKNKDEVSYKIAIFLEKLLYKRGIRKIPMKIQDMIMKLVVGLPMYPQITDYTFTKDIFEIKGCKTFFAVCNK